MLPPQGLVGQLDDEDRKFLKEGVAYLLGGTTLHIAGAITNLIEDLAGVMCDGAKPGCALKLATAAGTAVHSALFAL